MKPIPKSHRRHMSTTSFPELPSPTLPCQGISCCTVAANLSPLVQLSRFISAEHIYITFMTLLCNLLCVEASGFQGLELQKGDKAFPCFLLIVFPTGKSERGDLVAFKAGNGQPWRKRMYFLRMWFLRMSMQLLLEPCPGWVQKQWQRGLCNENSCVSFCMY